MNKVYVFYSADKENCCYVAATSFKEAKKYVLQTYIVDGYLSPFIEVRGRLYRDQNKKHVTTEYRGKLNLQEMVNLGFAWWTCDCKEGGGKAFQISAIEDAWKCLACGARGEVPYP